MARSVAPFITSQSRRLNLDPDAVLAVARGEGGLVNRPGTQDIGDLAGGGSYGPFQLYARGALPRRLVGNRAAADAWAWSPQGINYALSQIAKVAAGRKGKDAVVNIIRRFERPANPSSSIQAALARLGSSGASVGGEVAPLAPASSATSLPSQSDSSVSPIVQAILGGTDLYDAILASPKRSSAPMRPVSRVVPTRNGVGPPGASGGFPGMTELIHDPVGSIFNGVVSNTPYGGHGSHVHAAFTNPQAVLRAIRLAQQLGLAVRENPYTDPVDPVHTGGSRHYKTFPGRYNSRRLGQAVDVSGNAAKMRQYYQTLARGRR